MDFDSSIKTSIRSIREIEQQSASNKLRQKRLARLIYELFTPTKRIGDFILLLTVLCLIGGMVLPHPDIARWFGFMLASYSAIANDSIQTLGTFIASNTERKWWHLWLFIGLILIATVSYSWIVYQGDVSYQRLSARGIAETPQTFSLLQILAPIALLVLTQLRIPVSTSFLLLSVFAIESGAVYNLLQKSFYGYLVAFSVAMLVWYPFSRIASKYFRAKPLWLGWTVLQWLSTGLLWSVWLMHDAANIAVFLPRSLSLPEFLLFTGSIFGGLGVLFYFKGARVQRLVGQKAGITDIRAASLVDFVYILILFYFKNLNQTPMSTTWVFIGLLGGREVAISLAKRNYLRRSKSLSKSLKVIRRDLQYALIGLVVSIVLATFANPAIRESVQSLSISFRN
ncbi:MAG: hypothetical protein AAF400_02520 [Bacteroidota bacterium]